MHPLSPHPLPNFLDNKRMGSATVGPSVRNDETNRRNRLHLVLRDPRRARCLKRTHCRLRNELIPLLTRLNTLHTFTQVAGTGEERELCRSQACAIDVQRRCRGRRNPERPWYIIPEEKCPR